MFIFSWFDLFSSPYRNGFADGFSYGIACSAAYLLFRLWVNWNAFCLDFRDEANARCHDCEVNIYKRSYDTALENLIAIRAMRFTQWIPESSTEELDRLIREFANAAQGPESQSDTLPAWKAMNAVRDFCRYRDFHIWRRFSRRPIAALMIAFKH